MAMVYVDDSCQISADSQPKSIGLVWGLAATRRSVYIHQMNRVNSRNDFGHDDSTINIVTAVIIIITCGERAAVARAGGGEQVTARALERERSSVERPVMRIPEHDAYARR